jgi:hypothetical protein
MRVPNADPIGRGVVWARRIERVTSTVVNPRCSRMRLTCVYSVAAASRALCAWSAEAAMPAPRGRKHFRPSQAKTPHFPAARNRTGPRWGGGERLAGTSGSRIFQSLFTHTNSRDVFCGPRTREKRRTPSFSVSRGVEARRRGAASSNAGRARLARGSAVARRAARFSARTPDAATPKRRHLARPRVAPSRIAVVPSESFDSRPP